MGPAEAPGTDVEGAGGVTNAGEGVEEGNSCTAERVSGGGCWKLVLPLWRTVGSFSEGEKG